MPAEYSNDIFEDLLNLETNFYDEGYREGMADGKKAGLREGAEFGIQTGYQRYIALGVLRGRVQVWRAKFFNESAPSDHANVERIKKNIKGLEAMLKDIPITNSDEDVAQLEALLRKAKSKAKVTSSLIKDPEPLVYHDGTVGLRSTEDAIEDFRM